MKPKVFLLTICATILCCSCAIPEAKNEPQITAAGLPRCVANVIRDSSGKVTDVVPASGCHSGNGPLFVVGPSNRREPLRVNSEYITFGDGTTTCYGPPIPNPPRCVCTAQPCP
jgi:hypothetical protein